MKPKKLLRGSQKDTHAMTKQPRKGRVKKDPYAFIEDPTKRRTSMSKRRKTLLKMGTELHYSCAMDSFIITVTEHGKVKYQGTGKLKKFQSHRVRLTRNHKKVLDVVKHFLDQYKEKKEI